MTALRAYQPDDLSAVVKLWNQVFAGGPNFTHLTEEDFHRRVVAQPSFDPNCFLVAASAGVASGFVHFGPLTNFWYHLSERRPDPAGGQIWAVVAPAGERALLGSLLQEATGRLSSAGARRIYLHPSWVQSTQPFYNGVAGGYENPGLAASRAELLEVAYEQGFAQVAEYGTPELDLTERGHVEQLTAEGERIWRRFASLRLEERTRPVRSLFFPDRAAVELVWGMEVIAIAAYGLWEEHSRSYGRRMYAITGVQVARAWRRQGLGKLVMILAMKAALAEGAEALHLHVYRDNQAAWRLYHGALGFRPKWTWLTLAKQV